MTYKRKKSSSGNYRDVVNSKKLTGHRSHKAFAQAGISNVGTSGHITDDQYPLIASTTSLADEKEYAGDGVKNPYESIFDQVSKEKGVPKEILTALAGGESTFNRDSIGPMTKSGQAVGIMQLMPATIKSLGITDPNDPYQNISGGAQWLKDAYKRTGNWKDAVGEYNSGPDTWRKNKEGVMKQSPKYYKDIYAAIDSISGTQKPLSIPKFTPAVADKTSVARVPGKDNLFPIQRSTLASINKPLPQVKNEGIRPATEGYETEQADISQWMSLYDDPELATNVDFISNLFNHK